MNTTEIGAYIKEPHKLGSEHVQALKNLCEAHPYSGMLHMLFLKALGNSKSVDFESNLKHYAIHIPNRALLFHLIHDEHELLTTIDTESSELNNQDNIQLIEPDLPKETEETAPELNHAVDSDDNFSHIDTIEIQGENTIEAEAVNTTLSTDVEIEDVEKEEAIELHPEHLQTEDFESFTNQSAATEEINETPTLSHADDSAELEITIDNTSDINSIDNTITFEGFSALEEEVQKEEFLENEASPSASLESEQFEPLTTDDGDSVLHNTQETHKKSFYDWLNPNTDRTISTSQEETTDKIEIRDNQTAEIIDSEDIEELSPEKSKEKVQAIVDKFIQEEPRISRPKAEFFSPVKNAKESVNEDGIPVSETLAKIYELQGNYPKAILVYEKLQELMPQKINGFTVKIAELKNKMSS